MFNATKLGMLCGAENSGPFLILPDRRYCIIYSLEDIPNIERQAAKSFDPLGSISKSSAYDLHKSRIYYLDTSDGEHDLITVSLEDKRNPEIIYTETDLAYMYGSRVLFDEINRIGIVATTGARIVSFEPDVSSLVTLQRDNENIGFNLTSAELDKSRMIIFGIYANSLHAIPYTATGHILTSDMEFSASFSINVDSLVIDEVKQVAYAIDKTDSEIIVIIDISDITNMTVIAEYDLSGDVFFGASTRINRLKYDSVNEILYYTADVYFQGFGEWRGQFGAIDASDPFTALYGEVAGYAKTVLTDDRTEIIIDSVSNRVITAVLNTSINVYQQEASGAFLTLAEHDSLPNYNITSFYHHPGFMLYL